MNHAFAIRNCLKAELFAFQPLLDKYDAILTNEFLGVRKSLVNRF